MELLRGIWWVTAWVLTTPLIVVEWIGERLLGPTGGQHGEDGDE